MINVGLPERRERRPKIEVAEGIARAFRGRLSALIAEEEREHGSWTGSTCCVRKVSAYYYELPSGPGAQRARPLG